MAKKLKTKKVKKKAKRKNEWEVEKIVGKRTQFDKVEYQIKWKGWTKAYNTWEPLEHLGGCRKLVTQYEAELTAKASKASKKKTNKPLSKETPVNPPKQKAIDTPNEIKLPSEEPMNTTQTKQYGNVVLITPQPPALVLKASVSFSSIPILAPNETKAQGKKIVEFFVDGLPSTASHLQLPSIHDYHIQFLTHGLCQLPLGMKGKFTKSVAKCVEDRFTQIIHTLRAKDLQKELEDQGFAEFKIRGKGRYDMMLRKEEFPFLVRNPPWLPLVRQILGMDAALTFIGCIISLPDSHTQPFHSDGEHLSDTEHLPPHCINVFVPLVDLTISNGPTQFVPKSHIDFNTETEPVILTPKAGTAILFDYRLKHRGLGNSSKEIRPLLYFTYAQPHFATDYNFSTDRYLRLPELLPLPKSGEREERAKKRAMLKYYPERDKDLMICDSPTLPNSEGSDIDGNSDNEDM